MKEDIKDILWLAIIGVLLYVLSQASFFSIFVFVLKWGMKAASILFIFFAVVGVFNLMRGIIFKNKDGEKPEKK